MRGLKNRWLSIRRGWRIAITTILTLGLLLSGLWLVFYQRTALAREFDATLTGVVRLTAMPGALALSDDQIRQIIVPLRNLEIQATIEPDAARQTITDIHAVLTTEQLAAMTERMAGPGGQPGDSGLPGDSNGVTGSNGTSGTAQNGNSGNSGTGSNRGAPRTGTGGFRIRAGGGLPGLFGGGLTASGAGSVRRAGPLARLLAPLTVKLPQPAVVSQICQVLENRLDGTAPTTVAPPDGTTPQ